MARRKYVCRDCKMFTTEKKCPNCGSKDLSASWKGIVVVNKLEGSDIAEILGVSKPGKYALFVG